jgi:tetratricopeptide (TPR) repeat protein
MIMRGLMKELLVTILLFVLPLGLLVGVQGCGQSGQSNQSTQAGQAAEAPKTDEEASLPPDAAKHFEEGVRNLQENKIPDALGEFQQAVQLAPNVPAGHLWLGRVYLSDRKLSEAETELKQVLALAPKNYTAMILLGRLYSFDPTRVNQAEDYLQQALKISPDSVEAHFDLGRIYALKGERRKAIEAFNFIFFKERDFHIYHYEVGRILEEWGEKDEALKQYRQALLFNANFAEAKDAVQRLANAQPKPQPAPGAPEDSKQNKKGKIKPNKP